MTATTRGVEKIPPEEVHQLLKAGQCLLMHVRGKDRASGHTQVGALSLAMVLPSIRCLRSISQDAMQQETLVMPTGAAATKRKLPV
eukprot:s1372_g2.t2